MHYANVRPNRPAIDWLRDPTPAGLLIYLSILILLSTAVLILCGSSAGGGTDPPAVVHSWLIPESECSCADRAWQDCDDPEPEPDDAVPVEDRVSRDQMVREVVALWEMYFDDDRAPADDPRRARFEEHARDLADAVILYQDEPTDIGGQLPGHRDDHLIVAYMVAKESSVTYDAIGTSHGEVGLLQLHGVSLAGYQLEQVQHNPRLGLLLGVRWLAAQLPKCRRQEDLYDVGWTTEDWTGPLSLYAGGPKAIRKDGTCSRYGTMRDRVARVRLYRTRIDHGTDRTALAAELLALP